MARRSAIRLLVAFLCLVGGNILSTVPLSLTRQARAAAPPAETPGEPLPPRALGRLGSTRVWTGGVKALAFSPGGKTLATGGEDGTVRLWDVAARREVRRFTTQGKRVECVAFAPDGQTLAAAVGVTGDGEGRIFQWDVATVAEVRRFLGSGDAVNAFAFSPDGKTLIAGGSRVRRWDVSSGRVLRPAEGDRLATEGKPVLSLAYSPDGRTVAVGCAGAVVLYFPDTGRTRLLVAKQYWRPAVAYSPSGKFLGTGGDDQLKLWEVATGQPVATFGTWGANCFAFHPRGRAIAFSSGRWVKYADLATGKEAVPFTGHRDQVTCLAFSPDGRVLASGSEDGTVLLWDAEREGPSGTFRLSADETQTVARDYAADDGVPADARVSVRLDRKRYFLGENIVATFCVENVGKSFFHIGTGGDYRGASRHLRFHVTATGADGKEVPDPDPSGFCMGGLASSSRLGPGQRDTETVPVMRYCRFEKPGTYRLRVSHDLGWRPTKERPLPVAEATIALEMPNEEQARKVVDQMSRQEGADFSTLAYPVYLPVLTARAAAGDKRALDGLGEMAVPEASAALVRLLDDPDKEFVRTVARTLNLRLPDPELEEKLPGRSIFENGMDAKRRRLVSRGWRAEFAPAVRRAGRRLLLRPDVEDIEIGAFIIGAVGEREDIAALVKGLEHAAAARAKNPNKEERQYYQIVNACSELERAAQALSLRGVPPPQPPQTPGELVVFATTVGKLPKFRPAGWEKTYEAVLLSPVPYVRQLGLKSLPCPPPKSLLAHLPGLIADADGEVQTAACEVASKVKSRDLREAVLRVLASTRNEEVLRAADYAASELAEPLERIRLLVSRLAEDGMTAACLNQLVFTLLSDVGSFGAPTREMLSAATGRACKAAWQQFVDKHAAEIRAGKTFRLADPAVPLKELFPEFSFTPRKDAAVRDEDGRQPEGG